MPARAGRGLRRVEECRLQDGLSPRARLTLRSLSPSARGEGGDKDCPYPGLSPRAGGGASAIRTCGYTNADRKPAEEGSFRPSLHTKPDSSRLRRISDGPSEFVCICRTAQAVRFVSVRMGEGVWALVPLPHPPVYPRAWGQEAVCDQRAPERGLSPRAQERRSGNSALVVPDGFIPPRAGKAALRQGKQTLATVYPRARGKSVRDSAWMIRPIGLSLRARGRGKGPLSRPFMPRFIPAHAGKGGITELLSARRGVYPRARGRGRQRRPPSPGSNGLSPCVLVEGRGRFLFPPLSVRFIPARVGKGHVRVLETRSS